MFLACLVCDDRRANRAVSSNESLHISYVIKTPSEAFLPARKVSGPSVPAIFGVFQLLVVVVYVLTGSSGSILPVCV